MKQITRLLKCLILPIDAAYEYVLFWINGRSSPSIPVIKKQNYELIMAAHTIEKGLSLPSPRPMFGLANILKALRILNTSDWSKIQRFGISMAMGSIREYIDHHKKKGEVNTTLKKIESELIILESKHGSGWSGGTKSVADIGQLLDGRRDLFSSFLLSRYSCRNYKDECLPRDTVNKMVRIAQMAPSQCNRQSARAHLFQDRDQIIRLLKIQRGSRGFENAVRNLFVITSDMCAWTGGADRNQCYVDAALFSMALMYGGHALGVATCPLNFAQTGFVERRFKKIANIQQAEKVVLLIACGWADDARLIAARSSRMDVDDVLILHNEQSV